MYSLLIFLKVQYSYKLMLQVQHRTFLPVASSCGHGSEPSGSIQGGISWQIEWPLTFQWVGIIAGNLWYYACSEITISFAFRKQSYSILNGNFLFSYFILPMLY
jgi:hypothetical protein